MYKLLELEIFNFCNRTCKWCPNSFIDRRTKIKYLDLKIIYKIGKFLKKNNTIKYISFSRYNEPLYDISYLNKVINILKKFRKDIRFVTNTNGDYLNINNIYKISNIINELTIMNYDDNNHKYDWIIKILSNLQINNDNKFIYGNINNMKICIYKYNENDSCNRGGILNKYNHIKQYNKCFEINKFIGIDYNGNVMPCCNFRSDVLRHKKFILGNLYQDNLNFILNKNKLLLNDIKNIKFNQCKYCNKIYGRYTKNNSSIFY